MATYRPQTNFNVPMKVLIPTYVNVKGVNKKVYPDIANVSDDCLVFASFKTYGGSETNVNDVYTIIDTATVTTWYNPLITSECRIALMDNSKIYEVINEPENIEMRNQFMQFKVKRVGGKA